MFFFIVTLFSVTVLVVELFYLDHQLFNKAHAFSLFLLLNILFSGKALQHAINRMGAGVMDFLSARLLSA